MDELDRRHAALIERDRMVGLEAEAESARAHAALLEARLAVARERLARKNERIRQLAQRVRRLEAAIENDGQRPGLRMRLSRAVRGR